MRRGAHSALATKVGTLKCSGGMKGVLAQISAFDPNLNVVAVRCWKSSRLSCLGSRVVRRVVKVEDVVVTLLQRGRRYLELGFVWGQPSAEMTS